jgi:hypothetical protein
MTDKTKIATRLREHSEALDYDKHKALVDDLDDAADLIEELQKKLDARTAGFERLARQVDTYKRAGKATLDKFVGRKKT